MKFVAFSLILHIFVLLTVPCEDTFAAVSEIPAKDVMTRSMDEPTNDIPTDEDCSPFCICTCRQVPAAFVQFTELASSKVYASKSNVPAFEYTAPFTSNFPTAIWQPPKA